MFTFGNIFWRTFYFFSYPPSLFFSSWIQNIRNRILSRIEVPMLTSNVATMYELNVILIGLLHWEDSQLATFTSSNQYLLRNLNPLLCFFSQTL